MENYEMATELNRKCINWYLDERYGQFKLIDVEDPYVLYVLGYSEFPIRLAYEHNNRVREWYAFIPYVRDVLLPMIWKRWTKQNEDGAYNIILEFL